MKRILLTLFLLTLVVFAGNQERSVGRAQTTARPYESVRGLFTVVMPGDVQESPANNESASTGKVVSSKDGVLYQIGYTYSCAAMERPGEIMDLILEIQRKIKARTDYTIISEKITQTETTANRRTKTSQGYDCVIESGGKRISYSFRFADPIIYELTAVSPKDSPETPQTAEFFSSFTPVPSVAQLPSFNSRMAEKTGLGETEAIIKGKAVKLVPPAYPPLAREKRIAGRVKIRIVIDEKGNVSSAQAICGVPILAEASLKAALASKFKPSLFGGVPFKVTGILTYNFSF